MQKKSDEYIGFNYLWKKFYTGPHVIIIIILLCLSCWGVVDSFHDIHGDRFLSMLPITTPAMFTVWQMLSILTVNKEKLEAYMMVRWYAFAETVGSIPIILANLLIVFIARFIPGNQSLISSSHNYLWEDPLVSQMFLIVFLGYVIQLTASILIFFIIILPVISLKKNSVIVKDSNLEGIKDKKLQRKLTSTLFTSVAIFMAGTIIAWSTLGLFLRRQITIQNFVYSLSEIWEQIKRIFEEMSYGMYGVEQIIWLIGILMMATGFLSFIWSLIDIKIAKAKK